MKPMHIEKTIKLLEILARGHHGMGLHKRPTVGSGKVPRGTYSGGTSWPKPAAETLITSHHVSNAISIMNSYSEQYSQTLNRFKHMQSQIQSGKDIPMEDFVQLQKQCTELNEQIRKTLHESLYETDTHFKQKIVIDTSALEEYTKDYNVELYLKNFNNGLDFVQNIVGEKVGKEINSNKKQTFQQRQITDYNPITKESYLKTISTETDADAFAFTGKYDTVKLLLLDLSQGQNIDEKTTIGRKNPFTGQVVPDTMSMSQYLRQELSKTPLYDGNALSCAVSFAKPNERSGSFYQNPVSVTATFDGKPVLFLWNNPTISHSVPLSNVKAYKKDFQNNENSLEVYDPLKAGGTAAHELAHHVEVFSPTASKIVKDFLERRIKDKPLQKLDDVLPNHGYTDKDLCYDGGFVSPYVGRVYGPLTEKLQPHEYSPTEVLSVGIENLYENPMRFFLADPDHFATTIAAIKGVPYSATTTKGHHGMGLHVRPHVGSGQVSSGTYSDANSWPSVPLTLSQLSLVSTLDKSKGLFIYQDENGNKYSVHSSSMSDDPSAISQQIAADALSHSIFSSLSSKGTDITFELPKSALINDNGSLTRISELKDTSGLTPIEKLDDTLRIKIQSKLLMQDAFLGNIIDHNNIFVDVDGNVVLRDVSQSRWSRQLFEKDISERELIENRAAEWWDHEKLQSTKPAGPKVIDEIRARLDKREELINQEPSTTFYPYGNMKPENSQAPISWERNALHNGSMQKTEVRIGNGLDEIFDHTLRNSLSSSEILSSLPSTYNAAASSRDAVVRSIENSVSDKVIAQEMIRKYDERLESMKRLMIVSENMSKDGISSDYIMQFGQYHQAIRSDKIAERFFRQKSIAYVDSKYKDNIEPDSEMFAFADKLRPGLVSHPLAKRFYDSAVSSVTPTVKFSTVDDWASGHANSASSPESLAVRFGFVKKALNIPEDAAGVKWGKFDTYEDALTSLVSSNPEYITNGKDFQAKILTADLDFSNGKITKQQLTDIKKQIVKSIDDNDLLSTFPNNPKGAALAAQHAYTYSLLENVDMPMHDQQKKSVLLWRTEAYRRLGGDASVDFNLGDTISPLRNLTESYSAFRPVFVLNDTLTATEMPFHRILGTYHETLANVSIYNEQRGFFAGNGECEYVALPFNTEAKFLVRPAGEFYNPRKYIKDFAVPFGSTWSKDHNLEDFSSYLEVV